MFIDITSSRRRSKRGSKKRFKMGSKGIQKGIQKESQKALWCKKGKPFGKILLIVKSRAETRVTIQEIKSLGMLQTKSKKYITQPCRLRAFSVLFFTTAHSQRLRRIARRVSRRKICQKLVFLKSSLFLDH